MKDDIKNINDYLMNQRNGESKEKMDLENLRIAQRNGFETYQDYIYSMSKEYSVNPSMPLNKVYYNNCQKYLINILKTFLIYKKTGKSYSIDKEGNRYDLTIYSLNQLISAIYRRDKDIISYLDKRNLSINDFIRLIYTTELQKEDENKLGVKRGI